MWTAGDAVRLSLRVCGGTLSWESRPWSPALCPLLCAHWSSRCDHAGPRGGSPAPLHAQVSPNFGPGSPGEGSFAWRGPLLSHEGQGKRDSVQVPCGLRSRAGVSPPWPGPFSSSASLLTAQVRGGGSREKGFGDTWAALFLLVENMLWTMAQTHFSVCPLLCSRVLGAVQADAGRLHVRFCGTDGHPLLHRKWQQCWS